MDSDLYLKIFEIGSWADERYTPSLIHGQRIGADNGPGRPHRKELEHEVRSENTTILNRLALANVSIGFESEMPCINFDVLVDGKNVGGSLEWLDADGDLVREDQHLLVNREILCDTAAVLDDDTDFSDVYVTILALLSARLESRKAA